MTPASDLPPPILRDAFRVARRPLADSEVLALRDFGSVARTVLEPAAFEVDRHAPPRLLDDPGPGAGSPSIVLSPGHTEALDRVYATGLVGAPGAARDWPLSFAYLHELADVGLLCSATVTLATVFSLEKWGSADLRQRFLSRLTSDGGRAQGATWATEEQGGSDLGSNRSTAIPDAGERWWLTGEKFFCSNVGARYAVVTARAKGAAAGIHGIRLFFVPAIRSDDRPNWRVRRLKQKLGTITVPTGEVSFDRAEAYPLGSPEVGATPVLEMLNVSRIANAVGCAAILQRAAETSLAYAQRRSAFGRPLRSHPLLALDLATLVVESDAASLFAFDGAFRLAKSIQETPPYTDDGRLLQLTAHIAKLVTAEQAVRGAELAMEILGGVGYLEELPIAKLVRDVLVTPIWEGGANIQALEARQAVRRHHVERRWVDAARRAMSRTSSDEVRSFLADRLAAVASLTDEVDAKRAGRLWGDVRELTLLVARSRLAGTTVAHQARAQLFVQLRSPGSSHTASEALVREALDGLVPAG